MFALRLIGILHNFKIKNCYLFFTETRYINKTKQYGVLCEFIRLVVNEIML